jgi:hypothetical protein
LLSYYEPKLISIADAAAAAVFVVCVVRMIC